MQTPDENVKAGATSEPAGGMDAAGAGVNAPGSLGGGGGGAPAMEVSCCPVVGVYASEGGFDKSPARPFASGVAKAVAVLDLLAAAGRLANTALDLGKPGLVRIVPFISNPWGAVMATSLGKTVELRQRMRWRYRHDSEAAAHDLEAEGMAALKALLDRPGVDHGVVQIGSPLPSRGETKYDVLAAAAPLYGLHTRLSVCFDASGRDVGADIDHLALVKAVRGHFAESARIVWEPGLHWSVLSGGFYPPDERDDVYCRLTPAKVDGSHFERPHAVISRGARYYARQDPGQGVGKDAGWLANNVDHLDDFERMVMPPSAHPGRLIPVLNGSAEEIVGALEQWMGQREADGPAPSPEPIDPGADGWIGDGELSPNEGVAFGMWLIAEFGSAEAAMVHYVKGKGWPGGLWEKFKGGGG